MQRIENLDSLSPIGFGCYRISIKSEEHTKALRHAIKNGCNLIDTSANYTDGDSEKLVGKIATETDKSLFIITKAGYIQGSNLALVKDKNLNEDLVNISDNLKHSIHPDFLESQLQQSLERMKLDQVDCLLLHNPEYYFEVHDGQDEYYRRIEKAFVWLEEQAQKSRIRYYGVSSNTLPLKGIKPNATDISRLIEIANRISSDHKMRFIQFPYNLIENQAKTELIQALKINGIRSLANRPLNAFKDNQLIRLANYNAFYEPVSAEQAAKKMEYCLDLLKDQFAEQGEAKTEQEIVAIPFIKQFLQIWTTLPSQDAVDQVFMGHFFPLIANVYGRNLTANESQPFYELYEIASRLSRQTQTLVTKDYLQKNDLKDYGESLSRGLIQEYLKDGIDHVLVGMKRTPYVDQLKELF